MTIINTCYFIVLKEFFILYSNNSSFEGYLVNLQKINTSSQINNCIFMKRLISIIFLSLLVMKIGGYFALVSVQQIIAREEAKEKIIKLLPNEKLVKLSFTRDDFAKIDWQEQDKEFYYNEKLYDIVRSEFNGKNHILYCLSDEKETIIYAKILQISKAQSDELPIKNTMASFLSLLILKYTLPQVYHFIGKVFILSKNKHFSFFLIHYSSITGLSFSPPPEV